MSTRERASIYSDYSLSRTTKLNAPFKAPTSTMPAGKPRSYGKSTKAPPKSNASSEKLRIDLSDDEIYAAPRSDSSDDDCSNLADIRPSTFAPKNSSVAGSKGSQGSRSTRATARTKTTIDSNSPGSPKRAREDNGSKVGARMSAAMDFTTSSRRRQPKNTFVRGNKSSFGWTTKTSSKINKKRDSQVMDNSDSDDGSPTFVNLPSLDNFDSDISPAKSFINPRGEELENDETPVKKATFNVPPVCSESPEPTSTKKSKRRKGNQRAKKEDSDDEKPAFRKPLAFDDSQVGDTSLQIISSPLQPKAFRDIDLSETPQALLEDIPDAVRDLAEKDGYGGLLQSLSGPDSSSAQESTSTTSKLLPTLYGDHNSKSQAVCPMCDEAVDAADLKAWGVMNAQRQVKFCHSHKKKKAKATWTSRGYPDIDWENLDIRISKHHSFIKRLINGTSSHYGKILDEAIKAGKQSLLKDMSSTVSPGYYGARGLRAITDNIMDNFSPLLKKRAVEDRLIAARGMTTFVQAVLVPEVACRMIMEDMDIEVEEARVVMVKSIDEGELINEEIKDTIVENGGWDE